MKEKILHIVTLDIPYPPQRGGIMDMYYRIKALSEAGIKIKLHCYYKDFNVPEELANLCTSVYLYERKAMWNINRWLPLFIQSRRSVHIIPTLCQDDYPILFEGLHCMYIADHPALKNRSKYLRMLNIEEDYYKQLYKKEFKPFKKLYYFLEYFLLKNTETRLWKQVDHLFCISAHDTRQIVLQNGLPVCTWIPPFATDQMSAQPGLGKYALYHGDLSINENSQAVEFLLKQVAPNIDFPIIVAGHQPSPSLKKKIRLTPGVQLIESPDNHHMDRLIKEAQIILLAFSHTTGYKIKIVQSLFQGRHLICSHHDQTYEELQEITYTATTALEWQSFIHKLKGKTFTSDDIQKRKKILQELFNNASNAQKLIEIIWPKEN